MHLVTKVDTNKEEINQAVTHSMFLVGNTGKGSGNENQTLNLLKAHLEAAPENSTVLFLGDQTGLKGMPSKSEPEKRKAAENKLDAQLDILTDFKGQPIFLPGNSDWRKYGVKGVKRQEKYIESALNKDIEDDDDWNNYFLPDGACPGPDVIEINDELVVIVIDSQWWLMDWDEQPNVNEGCEVKSRLAFELAVEDVIKDNKNKNIVFAAHHSIRSVGRRGGYFTFKDHLFPLPIVGSAFLLLRKAGILQQDIPNRHYEELANIIEHPSQANGEFIFAGASDYSLQYLKDKGQHFVMSGGGGEKITATTTNGDTEFSYGKNGFSKIDFYEDGSAWIEFWTPSSDGSKGEMVFRSKMKGPLPKVIKEDLPSSFPEFESKKDSVYTTPSTRKIVPLGKFATFMLGERRRSIYLEKYNFPTLDLSTFQGGLTVIKKGGGKQTNSLRFKTKEGQEYVIRSLTKDATRGVPYPFNQLPVVNYLFSETFLGSHCFAPLTLSVLADAAKVYHTNPGLYYVPKQPTLGTYNDMFGGEVYLVEERASKKWPEADNFGNATKFVGTPDLNLKREKNHKHRVDQRWVVRSRLFDMLIGDIDRHGDQWRWTVTKTDKGYKEYRPIPRDRDNAYGSYDGFAFKILRPYHPIVRQLAFYGEDLGNPKWSYYNARHFDHNFMSEMTLEDWKAEAKYIQENVPDDLIADALSFLPGKVYSLTGDQVETTLKYRRDHLQEIAEEFYMQLAKKSIVQGTHKKEYFEVIRKDNEHTEINMYGLNKKGEKKERYYHRVFKTSESNEVYIYGLGGDDIFHISGEVGKSIRVYIVGGAGKDEFIDVSKVSGLGKKDVFYDTEKGNKVQKGSEAKDRTGNIAKNNTYEALGIQFDEGNLLGAPLVGFNAGDGFKLGAILFYKVNKFNKFPVGQKHMTKFNYSFATEGADLLYEGVFFESIKKWDIVLNADLRSNGYSFNFFGIGNDTPSGNGDVDDFRVQQSKLYFDLGLQRRFANESSIFSLRPLVQVTKITDTDDKFIDRTGENGLSAEDYEDRWYGGVVSELNFRNTDNDIHPRDGFQFNNKFSWQKNITGTTDRNFRTFGSDFTYYKSFGNRRALVLATRVGTELIRGNYDFFFAPSIGQDENIRGFFGQRYRGESTFYHLTDLRLGLGAVKNSILPFSMGLTGSIDYGRVFVSDVESGTWHANAGGGIWLVPLNVVIISATYNKVLNGDGGRFVVGIGHAF
ncbi:MAG: hypothetical protein ACI8YQ_001635 [Polaribacter sp.]|jgi:hypothetical protein